MGCPSGRLVAVDYQEVPIPTPPWRTPRFDEIRPRIRPLVDAFGDQIVAIRCVVPDEPTGAWADCCATYDDVTRAHAVTTTAGVLAGG